MIRYIVKRLLMMIPILLGISLIVLILIDITPGDPARIIADSRATEEDIEEIRVQLGLRDPFIVRYGRFIYGAVRGDFGKSFINKRVVWDDITERFPYTLLIVTLSMILSILIGVPLGVYAATHQYTWKDNAAIFVSLICVCMPTFWFALLLIQFFSVRLGILPVAGIKSWHGWILPVISLAVGQAAVFARQTRSNVLEVIRQDYITTARAKGQTERKVLYRHALKNALIPLIMIVGSMFGMSLGGAMITETVFSVPGLGVYTLNGLSNRDYPVIQANVLILSTIFSIVILLVDVIFAFVDPRIRSIYTRKRNRERGLLSDGKAKEEKVEIK